MKDEILPRDTILEDIAPHRDLTLADLLNEYRQRETRLVKHEGMLRRDASKLSRNSKTRAGINTELIKTLERLSVYLVVIAEIATVLESDDYDGARSK